MLGSWNRIFHNTVLLKSMLSVLNQEYRQYQILPTKKLVFEAFKQCPYENVRVIFIAQDPYPQPGFATGLALANPKDSITISPSLAIMRDRLFKDYGVLNNEFDPTLINWAQQGVLLLNAALTVRAHHPGSHTHIWEPFIIQLINYLNNYNPGLIYVLLGKTAERFEKYIGIHNYILKYPHPAYFCRLNCEFTFPIYKDINNILYKLNGDQIRF